MKGDSVDLPELKVEALVRKCEEGMTNRYLPDAQWTCYYHQWVWMRCPREILMEIAQAN